jgi:hypothetical protein
VTDKSYTDTHQRSRTRAGKTFTPKAGITVTAALFELPPDPIPHPDGGWLPDWLANEIRTATGPRYRTNAAWCRCPKCEAIILAGLDDPCIAAPAKVDPTPLTPLQELVCALEHRSTYRLHLAGTSGRIQARDRWQPPAGGDPPVVPAHLCGNRFPGFTPPAIERTRHDKPPF